jgi:ParB/RepB/Spo0J family partition protein
MAEPLKMTMVSVLLVEDNQRTDGRISPSNPAMKELTDNIDVMGVQVPIMVRPHKGRKGYYDLIAGSRRLAAARKLKLVQIPVVVSDVDDQGAAELHVLENLQREDLTPLEEAADVAVFLNKKWTLQDIAAHIGKTATWVARRASLLKLSPKWKKALVSGKDKYHLWSMQCLELVARVRPADQDKIIPSWRMTVPTVMDIEQELSEHYINQLRKAPFDTSDDQLQPKAGSCLACDHRSSKQPGLFDDWDATEEQIKKNDHCLDAGCWKKKMSAHLVKQYVLAQKKHGSVLRVRGQGYYDKEGGLDDWEVKKVKQGTKGAKACLRTTGPQTGTIFWGTTAKGTRISSGKVKGKPSTLAERKKKLANRREALINGWLKEFLDKLDRVDLAADQLDIELILAVATFGVPAHSTLRFMKGKFADDWDIFNSDDIQRARIAAWDGVIDTLHQRLTFHHEPDAQEHTEICTYFEDYFGKTITQLRDRAAKEIPEPKGWAKLNADGTPKVTKLKVKSPAKSRTKSQAKKPAKRKGK